MFLHLRFIIPKSVTVKSIRDVLNYIDIALVSIFMEIDCVFTIACYFELKYN